MVINWVLVQGLNPGVLGYTIWSIQTRQLTAAKMRFEDEYIFHTKMTKGEISGKNRNSQII